VCGRVAETVQRVGSVLAAGGERRVVGLEGAFEDVEGAAQQGCCFPVAALYLVHDSEVVQSDRDVGMLSP
jgi:hypothetical protein